MSAESAIFDLLKGLCGNRVFPDVAPFDTARPYITYQQIGGKVVNYTEASIPNLQNGMFQVNCWEDSRLAASALAKQVENAFRTATTMQAQPISAPIAQHEPELNRYGTIQDFSIWSST